MGAVLTLAVTQPTSAFFLMMAYSLGLGIPFLIVGLFTNQAQSLISRYSNAIKYVDYAFGAILIMIGVLVFTNQLSRIANLQFASNILIALSPASIGIESSLSMGIAFLAGIVSFLSPCVLPLIPAFLSYLAATVVKR